ncbi:MAG: pyridoxamine 5'-phosphate oxidase family protein [Thaumarchaeota archaeon]|nr:pyridoxamine 5'-phosphate oxidase family protein [Nitrososphaerota archaeon]
MKTFEGEKGIGMSETDAREYLTQSKSVLILGTTNDDGSPVIHPVWYYFDSTNTKLYFFTEPGLKKTANIRKRSQVYFDVDHDRWPYMGVKGKGKARIIDDTDEALSHGAKILPRYLKEGAPMASLVLDKIKAGGYVVIEITPAYFTSWNYGKLDPHGDKGIRDAHTSVEPQGPY